MNGRIEMNGIRMKRMLKRAKKGFTLIELMVVVLIIAILAALIVPRVIQRQEDAKRAKAASDISELDSSLQQYHLDNDNYPTTEEGLNALRAAPQSAKNWRGPYLQKALPTDPWQNPYVYQSPGTNGQDFDVLSYGKDGQPGGEGDNADVTEGNDSQPSQ
jgi:general secretion pathway protein G